MLDLKASLEHILMLSTSLEEAFIGFFFTIFSHSWLETREKVGATVEKSNKFNIKKK